MKTLARFILITIGILMGSNAMSKSYMIYSVEHELPMTNDLDRIEKNYYVNMGEKQGLKIGTLLDVYRIVKLNDPYNSKKRYTHKMKVGQLEVIHKDSETAIAISKNLNTESTDPILEIPSFMVGDKVDVNLN